MNDRSNRPLMLCGEPLTALKPSTLEAIRNLEQCWSCTSRARERASRIANRFLMDFIEQLDPAEQRELGMMVMQMSRVMNGYPAEENLTELGLMYDKSCERINSRGEPLLDPALYIAAHELTAITAAMKGYNVAFTDADRKGGEQ